MDQRERELLGLLAQVNAEPSRRMSLEELGAVANRSRWDLHRRFREFVGETPKAYSDRVRLDRSAAALLATDRSVLDIALGNGFGSHEVFVRAFRRRFGMAPSAYRARGMLDAGDDRNVESHARALAAASPCLTLYRMTSERVPGVPNDPIAVKDLPAQTALVIRRTVGRSEIAAALGDCLPRVFAEAQRAGVAIASQPFARYSEVGMGSMTMEAGCLIADPPSSSLADGCEVIEIPACKAAVTIHRGPYDRLGETHEALERWMRDEGHRSAGASWEIYVTDPGEHPDPETWETEVVQPIA